MPINKEIRHHISCVILDLIGLIPICIASGVIDKGPVASRGYFPDDESLMYPYHSNTVPSYAVYAFGVPLTIIVVIGFELISSRRRNLMMEKNHGLNYNLIKIYRILFAFTLGYMLTVLITVVGKMTVGRLRPHFMDLCQPIPGTAKSFNYVLEYKCSRTVSPDDSKSLSSIFHDMKKSFPSGHSSVSMYNAVFLVIYIGWRFPSKRVFAGLAYLLQSVVICLAIFVCCSRILDNKHHWSDVLAGAALGTFMAIVIPLIITKRYYSILDIEKNRTNEVEAPSGFSSDLTKPNDYDDGNQPRSN